MSESCDFGLIGLAVMGENLALNVESRGYRVAVFNRTSTSSWLGEPKAKSLWGVTRSPK
jgi:6-phosphogluconate dehydrogenase